MTTLSPLDEQGQKVDWWFMYKVPKLTGAPGVTSATGYEYVYYDSKVAKVAKSPNLLTDAKSALGRTLDSAFKNPSATTGWVLYNDEMPASADRKDNSALGHTKGVIAFDTDSKTAFWLLHSWPKYAALGSEDLPTPIYGQTYLCVALDLATASKLALQMATHQEPQTYTPHLPTTLAKTDPLYRLAQPLNANAASDSNVVDYKSRGGLPFKVIAKNSKWGKDFWNDLVGPALKADMDVETWIRGRIPPILDSDGVHKTFDIKFIDLRPLGADWAWPETHDHAKWGITTTDNWVCVGDINRMITQEKRGGGTIAFQDHTLWTALGKTDLLVPPKNFSKAQALAVIKATHKKG
jgi:deoxyribonuclease-2